MQINKNEALAELSLNGSSFKTLFEHGSLTVEVYKPENVDLQQPHVRDEVYIIIAGSGEFLNNGKRSTFEQGDFYSYLPE